VRTKDKYDAERRDIGARTDKDPDGNELRVRFHQGGREPARQFQGAVGEAPIDIHAVMGEIKELEAKRADLDKQIEVYLKELGIVE